MVWYDHGPSAMPWPPKVNQPQGSTPPPPPPGFQTMGAWKAVEVVNAVTESELFASPVVRSSSPLVLRTEVRETTRDSVTSGWVEGSWREGSRVEESRVSFGF